MPINASIRSAWIRYTPGFADAETLRILDRPRQKRLGGRSVAERELEEAERAEIERTGDRLHDLQARLDRDASPVDVSAVRIDERAHRGRAAEVLRDLFGELEALLGVA